MSDTPRQPGLNDRAAAMRPATGAALLRSALPVIGWIAIAVLLQLVVKPMMGDFYAKMLLDIGTNIILAVSLTMVNGFTGQFSMGHAAFMAVGAYVAAGIVYYGSFRLFGDAGMLHSGQVSTMLLPDQHAPDGAAKAPLIAKGDLLFLVAILAGGVFAGLCGYLVGLPSLRLKGDYLAIVTLGFGEIVRVLIQSQTTDTLFDADEIAKTPIYELPKYLGGPVGFSGLPFYSSLFWAWLFAGITLLVAYRLKMSTYGRAFLSIREDEIAAEAMGIHTTRYKIWAFVISAFFAGVAGGIFSHTVGVQLNAGELGFQKSFDIIIMVVLGGLGSISGAAIAAVVLTLMPEALRSPQYLIAYWPYFAAALVVGMAMLPAAKRVPPLRRIATLPVAIGAGGLVLCVLARVALWREVDLSQYRMVLYALLLIGVMILRPQGIMGLAEIWDWEKAPKRKDA